MNSLLNLVPSLIQNQLYCRLLIFVMKKHFGSAGFKDLWNRSIASLTKGELHWVGMVLALESDPRVLLIDEYGTHLTNEMGQNFRSHLKRMNRTLGTTIIVSSPSESLVKNFASVIIFLDNGHISKIRSRSNRPNRSGKTNHRRRRNNNSQKRNESQKPKQHDKK